MVPKVASQSPVNIGLNRINFLKKTFRPNGKLENHISPKHNKEFKNFFLKLLCFD